MFVRATRAAMSVASVIAMGILGLSGAKAATQTDTFDVTATIIASCTISANNLAFGNYDPLAVAHDEDTTTISVTCSNGAPYNIQLNGGSVAGNVAARTMDHDTAPANTLNYSLFRDAGRTQNWGVTNGTDTVAGTGNGAAQVITVYGRIPAGQTTPIIGNYTDTVTATVEY
ncbi:MAG: Csu type fimbrial protein [Hyphomicrobiaceae bacterium]